MREGTSPHFYENHKTSITRRAIKAANNIRTCNRQRIRLAHKEMEDWKSQSTKRWRMEMWRDKAVEEWRDEAVERWRDGGTGRSASPAWMIRMQRHAPRAIFVLSLPPLSPSLHTFILDLLMDHPLTSPPHFPLLRLQSPKSTRDALRTAPIKYRNPLRHYSGTRSDTTPELTPTPLRNSLRHHSATRRLAQRLPPLSYRSFLLLVINGPLGTCMHRSSSSHRRHPAGDSSH